APDQAVAVGLSPAMAISLVYTGEHYIIDVLVGAVYALLVAGAVNAAAAVIARVRTERSAPAPSPAGTPGDPAHGPAGTVSTSVPVSALTISTMTAPTAMPEENRQRGHNGASDVEEHPPFAAPT
ncbi:MAG TPA: hypothetical protein VIQ30_13300, partial [Pseudonocardia sp.]